MEPKLIAEVQKNCLEVIKIHLTEFKGQALLDLRVWIKERADKPAATPTKKGISVPVRYLPWLIEALQKANEALPPGGQKEKGEA
jgi:hypothetical protein